VTLPKTATDAELSMMIGLVLMMLGAIGFAVSRRRMAMN
jgi:LPXTG-motif cell wall-anchored protein